MKHLLSAAFISVILLSTFQIQADDKPDHFKGKPSDTLEQAVANFSEYNQKLKTVLAGELTPLAIAEIHELTYTIEVALEKIHAETAKLKDVLEEVHVASEHMDTATAKARGDVFINTAQTLVK
ncbi:DUF6746 family protein [Rheinheimera gaetbuli]